MLRVYNDHFLFVIKLKWHFLLQFFFFLPPEVFASVCYVGSYNDELILFNRNTFNIKIQTEIYIPKSKLPLLQSTYLQYFNCDNSKALIHFILKD